MENWVRITFLIHLCVTWAMIGAVWFVQFVHYPVYRFLQKKDFYTFQKHHIKQTKALAIPVMVVEAITGILLLWGWGGSALWAYAWINFFLLILIWVSSFHFCMKCHNQLSHEYSPHLILRLLHIHQVRTCFWTARGLLLFLVIFFY